MFKRFTDKARQVIVLSAEEARGLNHGYIGTEHILLGLIREGEGVGARALEASGVSLEAVRDQVEEIIGLGGVLPGGHIPLTPRAKKVLDRSLHEALQLGHNYIGTEHILLGLIREGEGVAAQVLARQGADLGRVRSQAIRLLFGYSGPDYSSSEPGDPAIDRELVADVAASMIDWELTSGGQLKALFLSQEEQVENGLFVRAGVVVSSVRSRTSVELTPVAQQEVTELLVHLFGLETINRVLRGRSGLKACIPRRPVLFSQNRAIVLNAVNAVVESGVEMTVESILSAAPNEYTNSWLTFSNLQNILQGLAHPRALNCSSDPEEILEASIQQGFQPAGLDLAA